MASVELKAFIETRLSILSPGIDLSSGSPAQTQFVQPLVDYLGTDPFTTDIASFLQDRFLQEFPDIYPGDPGVINDTFVNPLIMFLEPFKRETTLAKNDQSLANPDVLSDAGADALGANWFAYRSSGGFARGVIRVYFANPVSTTFQITSRAFTSGGLNFFPTAPVGVTAEEMVFNRQGSLFFVDVQVQAESSGSEYNIGVEEISGLDGVFGYIKVTNLQPFSNGSARVSTPEFIANIKSSLNERSLVTRRGATARILDVFRTSVRSVQEIGAQDEEMHRDILMATGPGHAWVTGSVSLFGKVAYVQATTVDDPSSNPVVHVGDIMYMYLDKYSYGRRWQGLDQSLRFLRFKIEEVIAGPLQETENFQLAYIVRVSGEVPPGLNIPSPSSLPGGLLRKPEVVISSVDGADEATVESGGVHVYGKADIYVKPITQDQSLANISYLTDDPTKSLFKLQGLTLRTYGEDSNPAYPALPNSNRVNFVDGAFSQDGVEVGDTLVIESGSDAGTYRILAIDDSDTGNGNSYAFLSRDLVKSDSNIRFSVLKSISINPFSARKLKAPFAESINSDLQTFIGSNAVRVASPDSNVIELGAAVNDTLQILTGPDAGSYTITGFNSDGKEFYIDRVLTSSGGGLTYEIYTRLGSLTLPLLRVKKIDILDSSNQTTGVTVPPADPVAVVPVASMTSAAVRGSSSLGSGFVLPAITNAAGTDRYITNTSLAAVSGDRRYSMGFDSPNGGYYLPMQSDVVAEFLFPLDAEEACSYFMATSEDDAGSENFPPVDPKPGDAITLKTGPNKGSYLVKSVYKFKHTTGGKVFWTYFIKIHGTFPVDVFRSLIEFLDSVGETTTDIKILSPAIIAFPTFFSNAYAALSTKLDNALTSANVASPGVTAIQSIIAGLAEVEYEWGDPARGTLRTFVQEPTLFQMNTAGSDTPTLFDLKAGGDEVLTYRPDPNRYETHTVIPGSSSVPQSPLVFPRDYSQTTTEAELLAGAGVNPLNAGAAVGDILEIYPEVPFHGTSHSLSRQTAVTTVAGSSYITTPVTSGVTFTKDRVGDLLFIDEGKDKGAYVVQKFIDSRTLGIDKTLLRTTPTVIAGGSIASWGYNGSDDLVVSTAPVFTAGFVGKYITVYGVDIGYQGSYLITTWDSTTQVKVDPAAGRHLAAFAADTNGRWVITDVPQAPANTTNGTELAGLQPVRFYTNVVVKQTITGIFPAPSLRKMTVSGSRSSLYNEPYSIYRQNIRRVTSAEIYQNRDGPFYYFDTDVVSLGPSSAFNIPQSSYLTVRPRTFQSLGYRHRVDDNTLTYSERETGSLEFPLKVLPVTATDNEDSMISLLGAPVQIAYERVQAVSDVQAFASSPDDHVASADILIRHFLPSYVSYEASYTGGSSASLIATDIIELLSSLGIEATIDVSVIQKAIEDRGGNPETPTKLYVLVHDWDRRQWAEMSENAIQMSALSVPYNGTARVVSFTPGPDVSGLTALPYGEKINLQKL